jgi:phospholipid/cholesterol/gamma-HCH transport system substrate-binding protein
VAGDSYDITIEFADALGLPAHGLVKQDGLTVGEIGSVASADWHAVVTLHLKEDTKVPANTIAAIQQSSPLGEVFVSLDSPPHPSAEVLKDNGTIPLARTSGPVAIEDLIALMGTVTNGAALDNLHTIVTSLGQALRGNQSDVRGVLENADVVLQGLIGQRTNLKALLDKTAVLSRQLVQDRSQITQAVTNLAPVVQQLASQTDDIVGLLKRLRTLSNTGVSLARASGDDLVSALRDAGPVLDELSSQSGKARVLMERLIAFAPLYARASPGDYTNVDVDIFIKALTDAVPGGITLPELPPGSVPTLPPLDSLTTLLGLRPQAGETR